MKNSKIKLLKDPTTNEWIVDLGYTWQAFDTLAEAKERYDMYKELLARPSKPMDAEAHAWIERFNTNL